MAGADIMVMDMEEAGVDMATVMVADTVTDMAMDTGAMADMVATDLVQAVMADMRLVQEQEFQKVMRVLTPVFTLVQLPATR